MIKFFFKYAYYSDSVRLTILIEKGRHFSCTRIWPTMNTGMKWKREFWLKRGIVLWLHFCLCCRGNGNFKSFMNCLFKIPSALVKLKKNINGITNTMLASSLRELEKDGLVSRMQFNEIPPRVEYSLTEKGAGIVACILWNDEVGISVYSVNTYLQKRIWNISLSAFPPKSESYIFNFANQQEWKEGLGCFPTSVLRSKIRKWVLALLDMAVMNRSGRNGRMR